LQKAVVVVVAVAVAVVVVVVEGILRQSSPSLFSLIILS